MLKSLSTLPCEVRKIVDAMLCEPGIVKVIDRAVYDDKGMHGGIYIVMPDDTELWRKNYQKPANRIMDLLEEVNEDVWDISDGVRFTIEEEPMGFKDIDNYIEGVDYRVLSVNEALNELREE